jgi:hypothetical protein
MSILLDGDIPHTPLHFVNCFHTTQLLYYCISSEEEEENWLAAAGVGGITF